MVVIEHKSNIRPGYSAVLHIHAAVVDVQLKKLIALIDPKTGKTIGQHPKFIKQDQVANARFELSQPISMELFEHFPQLGRFVLCNKGGIVAVGKIVTIIE